MPFWTERREVKNFLPSDVILTTAGRKNLLPSVTASQCNVILKGFALKNLPATACHAERSEASPPKCSKA
ncbi:MAG TPA: hypothetical protein DHU85_07150 [Porphyromonadaceae bacterium]|nr:hypothetical protein [Porphyromonadaceae bacterium]